MTAGNVYNNLKQSINIRCWILYNNDMSLYVIIKCSI